MSVQDHRAITVCGWQPITATKIKAADEGIKTFVSL